MITRLTRFFLIIGTGLLLLDGALLVTGRSSAPQFPAGAVISTGVAAIGGPFVLSRSDGTTVTDATFRGKWMLIYFGYTHCPDVCPAVLANIGIVLNALQKDADTLQPLFITFDPERDLASVLSDYMRSFDPRIVALTGTTVQTDAAAKAYRVVVEPHGEQGLDQLIDHSSYLYLMDPAGTFVDIIPGSASGAEMAARVRSLMRNHSTPS